MHGPFSRKLAYSVCCMAILKYSIFAPYEPGERMIDYVMRYNLRGM